jgi:competence CoiA-like predicted nuclease
MTFIGLHKETSERIDITQFEHPRLSLKSGDCVCQLCGSPLMVRAGNVYRAHFSHYGERECHSEFKSHPESPEHREAKTILAKFLKESYQEYSSARFDYEVPIPEVRRVADLLVNFPMGWRIAHEIQLAGISIEELQARTDDYYKAGIDVVWWLGKSADTLTNRAWCVQTFGYCVTLNIRTGNQDRFKTLPR